jgi:hypothetical protein
VILSTILPLQAYSNNAPKQGYGDNTTRSKQTPSGLVNLST